MPMTKTAKIWTIIISIPVGLILLLMICAKIYFTDERLRALVIPKVESAMNRHVAVKQISLSVFPSIGVSIDSLTISNVSGIKFDEDRFISLDHLSINVKILPLITGTIEIGQVTLTHPTIYLDVTKEGKKNFSSGAGKLEAASGGTSSGSLGAGLVLSDLRIENGELEMVNNKFDSRMLLEGINMRASAESESAGKVIALNATSDIDKISYGSTSMWYLSGQPLKTSARISYSLDKDALSLDDVKGQLRDLPISVGGTISNLQQTTNIMDLTITSPGATMEQLLSLIPPDLLKKTKGLSASGDVKFSVKMTGPSSETLNPAVSASFSVSKGNIQYASLPKAITDITVAGSFDKPSGPVTATGIGDFSLQQFSAHIGSNYLDGKLHVSHFDDPILAASLSGLLNLADVKDFYPLESGSEYNGTVKADITIEGKVKNPQSLTGKGTIDFQNVTIQNAGSPKPITNLNGSITISNQSVASKQLAMNIGQSDLAVSFDLKNYLSLVAPKNEKVTKPSATLKLTSHQLRTADLMSETPPPTKEAKKPQPKGGALLPDVDLAADVSIDKLVTDKFTFNNAKGSVGVNNGIVDLKSFTVNAFQGSIQTKGTLDLRDEKKKPFNLDLAINNVESNALLSPFTSFGQYISGKMTMNTKLQGDLNDTMGLSAQTLTGDGLVKMLEGKLTGFPLTQKIAEFTGASQLRQVDFKDWTNAFSVANGRLVMKDLKVNTGTTSFLLNGSQGLDGSLDYTLNVKLPPEMSGKLNLQGVAGELVQYFKDKDGRLNLPFHVGGTTSSPALQLDTKSQEEAAKNALKQKANDALKNKVQEGLKNLFKKP